VISAIGSRVFYFLVLGLSVVFSSIYSLFIYQKVCSGVVPGFLFFFSSFRYRENFLVLMHLFPLLLLLGNIGLCLVW